MPKNLQPKDILTH